MTTAQRQDTFNVRWLLGDLITQVYQGSLDAKPWQVFLRQLRQGFAADAAVLLLGKAGPASKPLVFTDFHPNLTTAQIQPFFDAALLETAEAAFQDAVDGRGLVIVANRSAPRADPMPAVMLGFGMETLAGMVLAPCGLSVFLGLFRAAGKRGFAAEEVEHFSMIRPHLDQAVCTYVRIKRGEVAERLYADTISHLTIGAVLLDGRGRVIGANGAARTFFDDKSLGLTIVDDQLVLAKNSHRKQFHAALASALKSHGLGRDDPFVDAMRIDSTPKKLGIILRLAPRVAYQTARTPAVIVYLDAFKDEAGPDPEVICRLFGLTRSESRLVALLAEGFSLQEAARKLNLTESSVRTYSKKVFSKVGVSRQAELVSLVMKSAAVLAG